MFKNIYDTHSHSVHSPDGAVPVDDFCRTAMSRGMAGITISDHYDICDPYTDDFPLRFEASRKDTYEARNKYGDKLDIAFGRELGQPLYDIASAEEALSHSYDIVIASLHSLPGP
ncbi:MAG: PHP domain-containing protein, partial [Lachnospiraceae bacterium]|nr:PHP domain-containing protein [Lachnospiraceae bacterium]